MEKEKVNFEEVKCIKTITVHDFPINALLLLKDKRVASCSADKTIRKFYPFNDYHCDQVIKRHKKNIVSICQLDDGNILSCSSDLSL